MEKKRKLGAFGRQIEESIRNIQIMAYDAGYEAGYERKGMSGGGPIKCEDVVKTATVSDEARLDKAELDEKSERFVSESAGEQKQDAIAIIEQGENAAEQLPKGDRPVRMIGTVYWIVLILLPVALCAAGLLLKANDAVIVLLTVIGAAVGVLILENGFKKASADFAHFRDADRSERVLQPSKESIKTENMSGQKQELGKKKADVSPHVLQTPQELVKSANTIAKDQFFGKRETDVPPRSIPESLETYLQELLDYVEAYEESLCAGHDVTTDQKFGEWVQRYLVLCRTQNNPQMMRMAGELISRLASMKILVYAEVELNEDGKPDVPDQEYLADARSGKEYTEVTRPAVYTKNGLLARGEIR